MDMHLIHDALRKIGTLTMTTHDESDGITMHSRLVSFCHGDTEGIFFLTMDSKPFYRQLKAHPQLALAGIYPTSQKVGKNSVGQPYFPPGFTVRISGEAREIALEESQERAKAGSEHHAYFLEEVARYPAMRYFCIHKGKGEIYHYDFEMEKRDHKLLRQRFAFGGETVNPSGCRIDADLCIACGICYEACTFKAISLDKTEEYYYIDAERCDECGSCARECPQDAIHLPLTI